MKRRIVAVAVATFLALVAATLWVPVHETGQMTGAYDDAWDGGLRWRGIWTLGTSDEPMLWEYEGEEQLEDQRVTRVLHWPALGVQLGLVLAVGGLVALALHTRAARGPA